MSKRHSGDGRASSSNADTTVDSARNEVHYLKESRDVALCAAREAVRDSTRLTRLLSILNESRDLNILLDKALSTLSELFMAEVVILLDPVGAGNFVPLAVIGLPEHLRQIPFSREDTGFTMRVMAARAPIVISEETTETNMDAALQEMGLAVLVGLPVNCCNEMPRGVLILGRLNRVLFSDEEVALLGTMAYRIGQTLIDAQRSSQLQLLVQSGRDLSQRLALDHVASHAAHLLPRIIRADSAATVLRNKQGRFYTAACSGCDAIFATQPGDLAAWLFEKFHLEAGESVFIPNIHDVLTDEDDGPGFELPAAAFAAIPIMRDKQCHGILIGVRFAPVRFNTGATQAAILFGEQVTSAIENTILYEAVHNELAERKRLEEEQRKWERYQQQLQKANSLNSMAGAIAHHFNNQLCIVLGNLEILADEIEATVRTVTPLGDAMHAANKAAEVSQSMLTYIGQSVGRRKTVDVAQICRQSLPLLQTAAPVRVRFTEAIPFRGPLVNANSNQIQQLMANLVTNSWEAIGENSGTISVRLSCVDADAVMEVNRYPVDWEPSAPMYVCLTVADDGSGIYREDMDKLFDPFFSNKSIGRGLGLSLALGIVKAHGGAIVVESEIGRGSTFRVYLPVSDSLQKEAPSPSMQMPLGKGRGVLVVDDQAAVRDFTRRLLERCGFKVFTAKDGVDAISLFEELGADIDLLVCDLTMPRLNGWETVAALRQQRSDLPVVLFSGHDEAQVLSDKGVRTRQMSSVYFLHKPFQMNELWAAIEHACNMRQN